MKIGVIARGHFFSTDQRGYSQNDLALDGPHLDMLAEEVDELHICAVTAAPVRSSMQVEHAGYSFAGENVKIVPLGAYGRSNSAIPWNASAQVARQLLAKAKEWDAMYIFMPTWLGAIGTLVGTWKKLPMIVYLGTDAHEAGRFRTMDNGGWRMLGAPFYRWAAVRGQEFAANRATALIIQGEAMKARYRSLPVPVVEPKPLVRFHERNVFVRDDTCEGFTTRCLYVGSLIERKGVQFLIKAVAKLKNAYKLRLRIAGTGPLQLDLARLAKREGVENRVEFLGHVPSGQILDLYRTSDLFILPTLGEGFSRVLYEAMSQSTPIITTRVGGITGLLQDGWNALLVNPASVDALAEGIGRLIQNHKLRRQLMKNARYTYLKALDRPSIVTIFRMLGFTKPPQASAIS